MSTRKIELEIVALSHSVTQSHSYAVVLGEVNGVRRLPIVIGGFEAQAIAVVLENMHPTRPLTHDLMKNLMNAFNLHLSEVIIYKINEGIFYSKLVCKNGIETIEIDSRTSDALALAVRFNATVYTYENILDTAGIHMDNPAQVKKAKEQPSKQNTSASPELHTLTMQELENLLQTVLEKEDYIQAAKIRDEIKGRK